ncbi:MAG: DUF4173 domain-containing protein, partial [Chloroflexota bacterium]
EKLLEYISRLFLIAICAYLVAGVFLHASSQSRDERLFGEDKPVIRPLLGFTESSIVLGSVTILFLAFVIIQFRYFFGGEANIGVAGYTYSQYARRGFGELVTVAFFSLLLIMGLSTLTRRENEVQRRTYSGLNVAILVLVMVILVSAYQRLSLAIDWHGFSRLRLYPRVFLIWVGILFVAIVVLEFLHRERSFAFAFVLASLGFAVSLALVNVDSAIVRHNISRGLQGRHLNTALLASLSSDAVPALVEGFLSPSLPDPIRERVGAALVCYMHFNPDEPIEDWRSFNFSRWKAQVMLGRVQPYLVDYHLRGRRNVWVRTPSKVLYDCVE